MDAAASQSAVLVRAHDKGTLDILFGQYREREDLNDYQTAVLARKRGAGAA